MNRFVVGSGRCGSTLLGSMLALHPDVLSLSEFFAAFDRADVFSTNEVPGAEFADFLARPDVSSEIMVRRGIIAPEVLCVPPGVVGIPPLLIATLPLNFADPLEVHEEVLAAVRSRPTQSYHDHFRDLFDWLMQRAGKSAWLERSGTSIEFLPDLVAQYPDGRFVYLHRDSGETALSMMNHVSFHFFVSEHFDPLGLAALAETEYGGAEPSPTDPLGERMSPDYLAPHKYAEYLSYQHVVAFSALARLDPAQVLFVRFEEVVEQPRQTLGRIADFLELPNSDHWIEGAAELVGRGMPPARMPDLPVEERARVVAASRAGDLLVGRQLPQHDVCKSRRQWDETVAKLVGANP